MSNYKVPQPATQFFEIPDEKWPCRLENQILVNFDVDRDRISGSQSDKLNPNPYYHVTFRIKIGFEGFEESQLETPHKFRRNRSEERPEEELASPQNAPPLCPLLL